MSHIQQIDLGGAEVNTGGKKCQISESCYLVFHRPWHSHTENRAHVDAQLTYYTDKCKLKPINALK